MAEIAPHLKPGDNAPDITLLDTHGQRVQLSDFWKNGLTLMSFLRHFGCIHCRHRLAVLEQHRDQLTAAGFQLLAVGLGEPKHAERYCGKLAPHLTCFADAGNDGYYTWGLRQGTMGELASNGFNVLKASAKALLDGHIQGTATGDAHMLPGTFIIDRDGIIRYAYYSQYAGDDPAIDVLVAEAASLRQKA
ncbi:MAG: AhpC/TSA family protein [Chloroflexi bacterium]|nr:AhpC/TSA family protein [Chloroflexota bacterium]MCC6894509.1 AhpC/TSA family protein [Anaerolineae bacterium]